MGSAALGMASAEEETILARRNQRGDSNGKPPRTSSRAGRDRHISGVVVFTSAEKALLRHEIFRDAYLDDVDFSGADLKDSRFERASLCRADFSKADLVGTEFTECDLRGARFDGAHLTNCRFARSWLTGAIGLSREQRVAIESAGGQFLAVVDEDSDHDREPRIEREVDRGE